MTVEILKDCKRTGVRKGQIYEAIPYWLDPNYKVSLLRRLTKKDRKPIGKEPNCNEYLHNMKVLKK